MDGEVHMTHKGLRVQRDEHDRWYAALPNGPRVGAWQRVEPVDLINLGLTEQALAQVPVDVICTIRVWVAEISEAPTVDPVVTDRSATLADMRSMWFTKDGDGNLYFGWGANDQIHWRRILLRDLPYLGVDLDDVERMVAGWHYRARIPRVRLEA